MTITTSTSSTSTTGLLSSAGIGSGLDVKSIVAAEVAAASQPLNDLQTQASQMQTKLSALGSVKSYLATFRDAASALSQPATWNATLGTSSNSTAVSIVSGTGAAIGSYNVEVSKLAAAQTLSSKVFGPNDAVGAGTLSIQPVTGGKAAVNITIGATDTLAMVRDKINATTDSGATAHIQTDSTGSRLVIQATNTGAATAFKIGVTDADGNNGNGSGLSALAYDPSATTNPMALQQAGADAAAKINGVDVTSASNTLTNVLDGVTLTLGGLTSTPASVSVSRDTSAIKTNVTSMVTAYNALQTYLAGQTKYDAASKTAATLQGDSTTNTIRNQLRTMMGSATNASSTFTHLSEVGFDLQKDGTIVVNQAKLTSGLTNVDDMRKLFANSDITGGGANDGLATKLRKLGDSILGADGVLTSRTNGIQTSITYNSKRQADMQLRIDKYQARVEAQYTALDGKMSQLNSLSAYVTQQITQMNKSTG